ncbi:NAD-dependent succinate-semialdehyde dehydrogenase [Pseudonocardia ailaonensis]|uniref:NAD-dependent succinate-semialdehyde dehydrogenase n=1 Tax=Pseudonocardia ailaonensis TaxID=367279 RepID=A0ABN2N3S4_9PSEU
MTTTLPGEPVTRSYRTVNPATGKALRDFPALDDGEAEDLLARAHAAFLGWRDTPVAERVRRFLHLAELLESTGDELAALVTTEMGKPLAQSQGEVRGAVAMVRYYTEHGEELLADEESAPAGFGPAVTRREPVGVVLGIEPWNGPVYQAMRVAAPNLMLGNTVLLKPAELAAGSTSFLDHLFEEAGFPPGAFRTALVTRSQVGTYIADPRIRAVTLTGSDRAGSAVGEQAGRHVKPVVLELGGSDAFVVLDSADVPRAASTAAACRLYLGGQVCASPKRLIVTDAVAEEFVALFVAQFARYTLGDPFDPATTVGPLSSQDAVDLLQGQLQDAIDKGATVLLAGGRVEGAGAFFAPAVLTDITPAMRLFGEEAFGPVAMIYRVPDAAAAVELANASPYGLGGTVFGEDLGEARAVAARLDTGMVGVNGFLGAPVEIPFGGTKRSGVGRELGRSGMDPFANIKTYGFAQDHVPTRRDDA